MHGELSLTYSVADSAPFYFWSPLHCEATSKTQRTHNPIREHEDTPWPRDSKGGLITPYVTRGSFPGRTHPNRWLMPPFRAHFCGSGYFWFQGLPYIVILNKRNTAEWNGPPVNSLSLETLKRLYDVLSPHFIVVYHRAYPRLHASEASGFEGDREDMDELARYAGPSVARVLGRQGLRGRSSGLFQPVRGGVHSLPASNASTPRGDASSASQLAHGSTIQDHAPVPGHLVILPDLLHATRTAYMDQRRQQVQAARQQRQLRTEDRDSSPHSERARSSMGNGASDADVGDASPGTHSNHGEDEDVVAHAGVSANGGTGSAPTDINADTDTDADAIGDVSINDLLLSVLADADGFIAVQGGPSYLSLLWGPNRTAVIFQKKGPEVTTNAAQWFDLLSGTEAVVTSDQEDVPQLAHDAFVAPLGRRPNSALPQQGALHAAAHIRKGASSGATMQGHSLQGKDVPVPVPPIQRLPSLDAENEFLLHKHARPR